MKIFTKHIVVMLLLIVVSFTLPAQSNNFEVVGRTKINLSDVEDVKKEGAEFTVITNSNIYTLDEKGEVKKGYSKGDIKGVSFNAKRTSIYTLKSENTSLNSGKQLKYFATNNGKSFSCKFVGSETTGSWSNEIVLIDQESGQEDFFAHLVGIPAGIYCDGEYLWYLSNKSKSNENGILRRYDINTSKLVSNEILPVEDPKGLDIDKEGNLYVYSSNTNEIIKLRRLKP